MTMILLVDVGSAAPSNQTLSFSARLKNSSGGVVADGYYNITFRLYSQQSAGSTVWSETYHDANGPAAGQDNRIRVANGYFSVKLGSLESFTNVDWTGDLFLTMDIGGRAQLADTSAINWDGEMTPRIQLSAMPYAMHAKTADTLGGKTADDFLQVGSGIQDIGNDTSIAINKTGSGDLMQFQSSGTDVFTLSNTGSITMGSTTEQSITVADSTTGQGQNLTLAAGSATSGDSSGGDLVLQAGSASGTGSDGTIVMSSDVTVGAGQTITMVGGTTSMRPASPSEGTLYFDSDTKQLLVYANGKWQGERSTATKIVAASNSSQSAKDSADYVADGTADDVEINAAIAALPASGGVVYLSAGTYTTGAPVIYSKQNVTIQGESKHTTFVRRGFDSAVIGGVINMSSARSTLTEVTIDGRKSVYTSSNNSGLYMSGMYVGGHVVDSIVVKDTSDSGLRTGGYAGAESLITNSSFSNSNSYGIQTDNPNETIISKNRVFNNASTGIFGQSSGAIRVTNNDVYSNGGNGIQARGTISNNTSRSNAGKGIVSNGGLESTITSNYVAGNLIGIELPHGSNDISVSDNKIVNSSQSGIFVDSGTSTGRASINGNVILNSGHNAIHLHNKPSYLSINANKIYEYGGEGNYYGVYIAGSGTSNALSDNFISDSTGSGAAIYIGSSVTDTRLATNQFNGAGANGIINLSTSTIFSNQLDSGGKLINRSQGGFEVQTSTGASAMTIDGTTGDVAIAGTLDTTSAAVLNIGTTNATAINMGQDTTVDGSLTADAVQTNNIDTATASELVIGSTNATSVTIATDLTVGAGQTITMVGGATSMRPASPSEGTLYFDTETKQLLVYANGKWQGDRSTGSVIVSTTANGGPSGSIASKVPYGADFVNNSTSSAQVSINEALSTLPSSGGSVYLMDGVYVLDGSINLPNNTSLIGAGASTVLKVKNSHNSNIDVITNSNTSTGTRATIQNLRIDGNKQNQTSGSQNGINFYGMGTGGGSGAREGAKISDVTIRDMYGHGINLESSANSSVSNSTLQANNGAGLRLHYSHNDVITGNTIQGNSGDGINNFSGSRITLSANLIQSNSANGITFVSSHNDNITGNTILSNGNAGISFTDGSENTISSNVIRNNSYHGIRTGHSINRTTISNNGVHNNGSTNPSYSGIFLSGGGSVGNTVSDNNITDTAGASYAINVDHVDVKETYVSNNRIGTGTSGIWNVAGPIRDNGTGTIYANQQDGSGKFITRSSGGFGVQTSSGSDAMTIDATTGSVAIAGTLEAGSIETAAVDRSSAGNLAIGANNATSVTIGTVDTTGTLLVLDTKTSFGDPTGTNGAMYYNSSLGKFRCYQGGEWTDCITPLPVSVITTSDQSVLDDAFDVDEMEFLLASNTKYHYKFVVIYQSDSTNAGISLGVATPAAPVNSSWCVTTTGTRTSAVGGETGSYCGTGDITVGTTKVQATNTSYAATMEGYIETGSNAGTLNLRAQSGIIFTQGHTLTIKEGSYGILQIVQ